eukprot:1099769-Alexandrium_andersonii.AAC.1
MHADPFPGCMPTTTLAGPSPNPAASWDGEHELRILRAGEKLGEEVFGGRPVSYQLRPPRPFSDLG